MDERSAGNSDGFSKAREVPNLDGEEVGAKPELSAEAKQGGHRLYQWVYNHIAEDIKFTAQDIEAEMQTYGLSGANVEAALKAAQTEAEFRLSDIPDTANEEQWQNMTLLIRDIIDALFEVKLRQWESEK